jgi:hypothetical protein
MWSLLIDGEKKPPGPMTVLDTGSVRNRDDR